MRHKDWASLVMPSVLAQPSYARNESIHLFPKRSPDHALGYTPEAQDAVQEAFLIALRKIDQLREPEAVSGWLRAIMRNVCLSQIRKGQEEILFDELTMRFENEPTE